MDRIRTGSILFVVRLRRWYRRGDSVDYRPRSAARGWQSAQAELSKDCGHVLQISNSNRQSASHAAKTRARKSSCRETACVYNSARLNCREHDHPRLKPETPLRTITNMKWFQRKTSWRFLRTRGAVALSYALIVAFVTGTTNFLDAIEAQTRSCPKEGPCENSPKPCGEEEAKLEVIPHSRGVRARFVRRSHVAHTRHETVGLTIAGSRLRSLESRSIEPPCPHHFSLGQGGPLRC
jgi:hypothetical protein